ncbi:hypothetical protein NXS19_000396 [Fusarium pseudograminearum]|nr:hypothetical protein NXS19_000396 [Fusarium pseudograminearum]
MVSQHPVAQPVAQVMSPVPRPLQAPVQQFRLNEREPAARVPLPQKASSRPPGVESREQRPLAAAQPLQPSRNEAAMMEHNAMMERQKMEMQMREQEQQRELARQSERQTLRVKQEREMTPQPHHYEPYGHHRQQGSLGSLGSLGGQPLPRPLQESGRPQSYGPPVQQQQQQQAPVQPVRNLMGEQPQARSPQMGTPTSRPVSSLQQRPSSGSMHDTFGSVTPQSGTPVQTPAAAPPRPPEPRKGGLNIMSLLNDDDPPPQPKRVNDVTSTPTRPSPTPPPQTNMGGRPLPGPAPPSQIRREPESYSPFARGTPGMPPLKPTFADSPQPQHMGASRASIGVSHEAAAAAERDYYRQNPYQSANHSRTNSPQGGHRYPPPGPPQYQNQGYPTSYASLQVSQHMLDHRVVSMVILHPLLVHERSHRVAVKLHGPRRPSKAIPACSSPPVGHRNQTHHSHRLSSSRGLRSILHPSLKHQGRLGPHHNHLLSHHPNRVTTCP